MNFKNEGIKKNARPGLWSHGDYSDHVVMCNEAQARH